jgi:glucan phosphoethanolaminetransferase (alkaline phosphatase superfamily)
MQQFHNLLLDIYVWLNMFRALSRLSSRAYNCIGSLWFYRWSVVVAALLVLVWQTTNNNTATTTLQR